MSGSLAGAYALAELEAGASHEPLHDVFHMLQILLLPLPVMRRPGTLRECIRIERLTTTCKRREVSSVCGACLSK